MVTKFALKVNLTWVHQMTHSPRFDLLFMSQECKIQFWRNYGGRNRNRCIQWLV